MIKIGICDVDQEVVRNLLDMLKDVLYQYDDWEVEVFENNDIVMQAIDSGSFCCNLLFMDIFPEQQSGLRVAKYVKEKHIDTDIIFITTSKDYVFECYQYHTFAYLLKPLKELDITQEVNRYLQEIKMNPKCLNISSRGNLIRIPIDTILFIESNYRKIIVHTKGGEQEYYEKLDVIDDVLKNDGFIRCHQSYLVSADKVTAYKGNILKVGEFAVPISRKYKKNIRDLLALHEVALTTDTKCDSKSLNHEASKKYDNCYLTSGLFQNHDTKGALVCVKGAYIGNIVRIVPEQNIVIGRDGNCADMVVNLPLVSREHCSIIYHEIQDSYEVIDYSTNGTFIDGNFRMKSGDTYMLKPGTMLAFGDKNTVYRLG